MEQDEAGNYVLSVNFAHFICASVVCHLALAFIFLRFNLLKPQQPVMSSNAVMVQLTDMPGKSSPGIASAPPLSPPLPQALPHTQPAKTLPPVTPLLPTAKPDVSIREKASAAETRQAPASPDKNSTAAQMSVGSVSEESGRTKERNSSIGHTSKGNHLDRTDIAFGSASAPSFTKQAVPIYPTLARKRGKEGIVLLKLHISKTGRLTKVDVLEDPGFGFADAAIEAVEASSFAPGYHNGKPVAMQATLPVRFTLH